MLSFFIALFLIPLTLCEFDFEPALLAYKPNGFTAYIDGQENIKEFRFIGRVNNGRTIFGWVTKLDEKRRFSYYNKYIKLNIGDEITMEVTVWLRDRSEHIKNQTWTCLYYTPRGDECLETQTLTPGREKKACGSEVVFQDDFADENLNLSQWSIEKYSPQYSENNYEFVSYQDTKECKFISNSSLFLKPVVRTPNEMNEILDLRDGCTRSIPESCYHQQVGPYIIPPIKSAKIISKFSFKYGRIEIGAKLPIGDWIYPQVELVPNHLSQKYPKIVIAYSRGNTILTLKNGEEIGNTVLYAGFVSDYKEPGRSVGLRRKIIRNPNIDIKMYSIVWTPTALFLVYDKEVYGRLEIPDELNDYRISLGVGVGGNYDFPDNVKPGICKKPWSNDDAKQAKKFLDSKKEWHSTWHDDKVALQVDYVRVYAL